MGTTHNIYCDESRHLELDRTGPMVLGALWCPTDAAAGIAARIREIKVEHGVPANFEVKWTKVSPAKLDLYKSLVEFFFDRADLRFRALVAPKENLAHAAFGQDHDTWYYKMYFELLKLLLDPQHHYRIYLDIKDTRSDEKVRHLHAVLAHNIYDFDRRILERVQTVRSHEVELLQLADLFIGAVGFANSPIGTSAAKRTIVAQVRKRSGYSLTKSTLLGERKLNVFCWTPRRVAS
jgi:hypothetical protein